MIDMVHRQTWQRVRNARLAVSLGALLESQPRLTVIVVAMSIVGGCLPVVFAVMMGTLVEVVQHGMGKQAPHEMTGQGGAIVVVIGTVFVAGDILATMQNVLVPLLQERFSQDIRSRALTAVQRPVGIAHLEDPNQLELLTLVREQMKWDAGDLVGGGVVILTQLAQGLSAAALLATFYWWAGVLLAVTWLWARASAIKVVTHGLFAHLTELRRAWYVRDLATHPAQAKEVRLFGLHPWLLRRYTDTWLAAAASLWQAARGDRRTAATWLGAIVTVHALVFVVIARAAAAGNLMPGQVAIVVQAIFAMAALGELGGETWLENGLQVIPPVLALEQAARAPSVDPGHRAMVVEQLKEALRFEGVCFRYPGRPVDTLDRLDLEIPAGRSLAIVGDNGAGKTTLVKLLARLYDPDEGRITVDGRDLRDLDPVAWRNRLTAVFQDFIHYELSARENVTFGAPDHQGDHDALRRAAHRAGIGPLIDGLPSGWATVLSPRYAGGVDLSGGQWQRIALARALFAVEAGASILILDEPTAALDVRAEADLFDRFLSITAGLTTILVSHRFSTVRRADRIVVLAGGRIAEQGSHDDLVAAGGRYARMFALQADRFSAIEDGAEERGL